MTDELGNVIERLEKVSHYFKSELKVGNDGDAEIYKEHLETIKSAIRLLKWQEHKDRMFHALEDEIVRCKDCENFVWNSISQNAGSCGIGIGDGRNHWHSKDWYCANGVKKE